MNNIRVKFFNLFNEFQSRNYRTKAIKTEINLDDCGTYQCERKMVTNAVIQKWNEQNGITP